MQVVLANITAFNRRDLEAFLSTYASDAQMIDLPSGRMLTTGTATLRERYRDQFENDCLETMGVACPDLQVTIVDTQTVGNYVIAKEAARLKKDTPPLQLVVIYEVINARISRAWFIGK
ncbi:MAG TPA: nuclear transport factor 2 family protein [Gemmatimonadales bacterium]